MSKDNLEGLGGWLILVGIGVVMSPLTAGVSLAGNLVLFTNGTWVALVTSGSEAYNMSLAVFLIAEVIGQIIIFLSTLYMIFLFFTKKEKFPKWFIGFTVFLILFTATDFGVAKLMFPQMTVFDPETIKAVVQMGARVLIWVPYMLVSKRVRVTFVN